MQKPPPPAEIRVRRSSCNAERAAQRPHPSSKGISFFGREKEGKAERSAHSQLRFPGPPPGDPRSPTRGHRVSTAKDRPLITGGCRKLGLMGGPGSQDGVLEADAFRSAAAGERRRAQVPLGHQRYGVGKTQRGAPRGGGEGAFGMDPGDGSFGEGTTLTSCRLLSPRRSGGGHVK